MRALFFGKFNLQEETKPREYYRLSISRSIEDMDDFKYCECKKKLTKLLSTKKV